MTRPPASSGAATIRPAVPVPDAARTEPPILRRPAVYWVAAATVIVLGLNWPIMAVGVEEIPALWLAALRMVGAAAFVTALMASRGTLRRPTRQDLPILLSVGLARIGFVTAGVFVALRFVPPGRSSILAYTASLWVAPMAALVLHERLTRLLLAGLAIGGTGLVLLLEPWSLDWSDGRVLAGLGLLVLAAIVSAATTVHVRAHRWHATPLELLPWQFAVAALPILVLAWAFDGAPSFPWSAGLGLIVAYQFVMASAFGEWGALTVMRSLPAITSSLAFMAVPAVGLAASIAFVDESASVTTVLSLALVLAGVVLGLLSDRRVLDAVPPP